MGHINAPKYLVCSCKREKALFPDGTRPAIEGSDHWETFDLFSEAQAELDRLLSLDDTYTAQVSVVLAGDGSYDEPPKPIKFTDRFWQILKHQMKGGTND